MIDPLLSAFLQWYRETEALASAHPALYYRPPHDLRKRVAEAVRAVAPDPLPCPCTSCVNMRAVAEVRP